MWNLELRREYYWVCRCQRRPSPALGVGRTWIHFIRPLNGRIRQLDTIIEPTAIAMLRQHPNPRHWPRCVKGSISVSEGVLRDSGSHPYPLLSISYGPLVLCNGKGCPIVGKSTTSGLGRFSKILCAVRAPGPETQKSRFDP